MYGLTLGSERGIEQVLRSILAVLEVMIGLSQGSGILGKEEEEEEAIAKVDLWILLLF